MTFFRHGCKPFLLICLIFLTAQSFSHQTPLESHFDFTYQVRIASVPKEAGELEIWVPIAKSDQYQKILNYQINSPYPYQLLEDPEYGNKILHLSFDKPPAQPFNLQIRYEVQVHGEKRTYEELKKQEFSDETLKEGQENFKLYLTSQSLLVINDRVRKIAWEVTKNKKNDLEKAKAIYDYVIDHMVYDKSGKGWGQGSTVYACEYGRGNCTDFHSLFISLARAIGIPARFKIGAQVPDDKKEGTIGYHCWAEFFLPKKGWIPVDTSEAWKHPELRDFYFGSHDPGKFFISLGRDISLKPAQKGDPVNIFIYPYVEIDGKPFESVESQFLFKNKVDYVTKSVHLQTYHLNAEGILARKPARNSSEVARSHFLISNQEVNKEQKEVSNEKVF